MHDFYCKNADEMYNKTLAKRVKHFKEDSKGVNEMSAIMEELKKEAITETNIKHIKSIMVNFDITAKKAMQSLSIPEEEYSIYLKLLGLKE